MIRLRSNLMIEFFDFSKKYTPNNPTKTIKPINKLNSKRTDMESNKNMLMILIPQNQTQNLKK